MYSSPTVASGVVFVGSDDMKVYALDAIAGVKIWEVRTGSQVRSSPAVSDGLVVIGSYESKVHAFNAADGTRVWDFETGDHVYSSPAVDSGLIFVGSKDRKIYALSMKGASRPAVVSSPICITSPMTWLDAEAFCQETFGTHLVTAPRDCETVREVAPHMAPDGSGRYRFWLGLHDLRSRKGAAWVWASGEPVCDMEWANSHGWWRVDVAFRGAKDCAFLDGRANDTYTSHVSTTSCAQERLPFCCDPLEFSPAAGACPSRTVADYESFYVLLRGSTLAAALMLGSSVLLCIVPFRNGPKWPRFKSGGYVDLVHSGNLKIAADSQVVGSSV